MVTIDTMGREGYHGNHIYTMGRDGYHGYHRYNRERGLPWLPYIDTIGEI